jgi:hypothetical protein
MTSVLSPIARVYLRKYPPPPPPHTQGEYQQMSSGENTKNSKKRGNCKGKRSKQNKLMQNVVDLGDRKHLFQGGEV